VEINYSSSANLTISECGLFTSPEGNLISSSGIYNEILTNNVGCDSTLTLDVTITENNPIVSKNRNTLDVNINGLNYQWLDCNDMNALIPLATDDQYTPTESGDYAVVVTENNCSDTSTCINFPRTATLDNLKKTVYTLYPNPANTHIYLIGNKQITSYSISNNLGQIVIANTTYEGKSIDISNLQEGVYTIKVMDISESYYLIFHVRK
jgi:hypothetical protein